MSSPIDTVLVWAAASPPVGEKSLLQHWLDPAVPWQFVVCALVSVSFLSAAVSMHAWSGTRRNQEISSTGR
jgi:hypothetical protein